MCGHILVAFFNFISLLQMGNAHLNLSSLIVFGILIHIYRDMGLLPNALFSVF